MTPRPTARAITRAGHPWVTCTEDAPAYEVWEEERSYVFPEQPFRVLREITRSEYLEALPLNLRHGRLTACHYYEIATD